MSKKKSVCIFSTGGTISMQITAQGYMPLPGYLAQSMLKIPELNNSDMPNYTICEYAKPIDSANMTFTDWQYMAEFVRENYAQFDGFVILHGTDTMAYSASALSFMLRNLTKPVILTGSQVPLFATRNDARENLLNALYLAGNYAIPEVCVYFHNKLFRGNRSKKVDAANFNAFNSPNFPTLAKIGTEVKIRHELIWPMPAEDLTVPVIQPLALQTLRIFPGIKPDSLEHFLQAPLQALILETYGVGTAPDDAQFLNMIRRISDKGIVVVNCSQCAHAKIKMQNYATGKSLQEAGVISGADMTMEAIITKLFYLFSQNLALEQIKQQLPLSLRGELT